MKKQINLLFAGLMAVGCFACSEDGLIPSEPNHVFAAQPDANDEESVLRREFFAKHNCYIIFNDTLRHDYVGTDEYGDAFYDTELLDPAWTLSGTDTYYSYFFEYFTAIEEKRACAEYMGDVLALIENHNLTKPYSILAVKGIMKEDDYDGEQYFYDQLNTMRCFIVDLTEMDDSEGSKYRMAAVMAGNGLAAKYEQDLAPFFNLTIEEYGYSPYGYTNYGDDEEDFMDLGFLEYNPELYPTKGEDVAAYLNLLLTRTPEQVERQYRRYEIILQKYRIFKEIADKAGIKY